MKTLWRKNPQKIDITNFIIIELFLILSNIYYLYIQEKLKKKNGESINKKIVSCLVFKKKMYLLLINIKLYLKTHTDILFCVHPLCVFIHKIL